MSGKDNLKEALEYLRRDPQLRNYVDQLSKLLQNERGLTPRRAFVEAYREIIIQSLHHLSKEHIRRYSFRASDDSKPSVVLVSYNSSVVGMRDSERRITDWHPDSLSSTELSIQIAQHVRQSIEEEWLKKASQRPNVFELHLLAQKRISIEGSLPARLPLYIAAAHNPALGRSTSVPSGDQSPADTNRPELGAAEQSISAQGIFLNLPLINVSREETAQELSNFIMKVRDLQVNKNRPYPEKLIPLEDLAAYGDYLKSLLVYKDSANMPVPLSLCTIAISDELSNLPLGTAMVISSHTFDYQIAIGISHLCLDLFSAFYKIEQEASLLRETAFLITAWVHHEAAHWSHHVKAGADQLAESVEELKGVAQPGNELASKLAAITNELSSLQDDLTVIATTATISTELLRQLAGPSGSLIESRKFLEKVNTFLKLYDQVKPTVDVAYNQRFPRAVLLACCEFIRNAAKNVSDHLVAPARIAITLNEHSGVLKLQVESEPHDIQNVRALNDLNNRDHRLTLEDVSSKRDHLGGFLVHLLADFVGGHVSWQWEEIGTNRIRVRAQFILTVQN
jgi:hypothetical protein